MKTAKWLFVLLGFLGLVVPLSKVVALDCGGYCQSSGSCPATGRGCNPTVCCYCCYQCVFPICSTTSDVCGYDSSNNPVYWDILTQAKIYNCYTGSNCTYSHTSIDYTCNPAVCRYCWLLV